MSHATTYAPRSIARTPSAAGRFLRRLFRDTSLYLFASGLKAALASRKS